MSMSPSDESTGDEERSGILKASSPASQVLVGMEVTSLDGERLGRVKQMGNNEFLLDRPMARDLWVPFSAVLATEEYSSASRGPARPLKVVLEVNEAHVEDQGWRHS